MKKNSGIFSRVLFLALIFSVVSLSVSACQPGKDGKKSKKDTQVEVSIPDYCTFEFNGRDTEGTGECQFKGDDLFDELMDHEDRGEFFEDNEDDLEELIDSVTVSLTQTSGLSNGDMIPLEIEYDEDLAEDLDIEFAMPDVEVSGLEEPVEYDPFDDIEVSFSGASPYITVETDHPLSTAIGYYELDTGKEYYKEGESVVITADCDPEYQLEYNFINVVSTQKEYVAHTGQEYLSDISLFPDATDIFDYIHEKMRDEMNKTLNEYEIALYDFLNLDEEIGTDLFGVSAVADGQVTVDSAYYLTIKPDIYSGYQTVTQLVLIYKVPVSFPACPEAGVRYFYFTAVLCDIMNDDTGSVTADLEGLETTWYNGKLEGEAYETLIAGQQDEYDAVSIPVEDIPYFPYEVVIGTSETEETAATQTTAVETTAAP